MRRLHCTFQCCFFLAAVAQVPCYLGKTDQRRINSCQRPALRRAGASASASRTAAAEGSEAFDTMLRDRDMNRLFNDGALYFELPGAAR